MRRCSRPGGIARVVTGSLAFLAVAACSGGASGGVPGFTSDMSTTPPSPDPRVGLQAGRTDAEIAQWNMRLISNTPSPEGFAGATNSDLAFIDNYVIQGSYNGFMIWDATSPQRPALVKSYLCPASQSDVSVYDNLLFVSSESTSGRLDCGSEPPAEPVSHERIRGLRIFDITDIRNPVYLTNVQTCRGSHTHSVVSDPNDPSTVYVYISGSAGVRPAEELAGCSDQSPDEDPNSSLFRIEVVRVPLANPAAARIVNGARIFSGMDAAPRRTDPTRPNQAQPQAGPNQCHDITAYPEIGLAGGACQGYGILLDIRNPAAPRRIAAVADTNFATWHSVTFNNDGDKIIFTDEWGGGSAPRCRATDNPVWGGDAILDLIGGTRMEFRSYYKLPAAQTDQENCVAHNGSLVPVPGRDIKVQGWYQGGISMFDFTDAANPIEIAFFDRGPLVADTLRSAGTWSVYWYNGYIYNSEIARGLDVLELMPSGFLTQNELDAAKTVRFDFYNTQEQRKFVWPATFVLARAYLDQLVRSNGLPAARIEAVRGTLATAEGQAGSARSGALTALASSLDGDAAASSDARKVRLLAQVVRELATGD
jgi:hypothetical protein